LLDAVDALLMNNIKTAQLPFCDNFEGHQWTYTNVKQENKSGFKIIVGGFNFF